MNVRLLLGTTMQGRVQIAWPDPDAVAGRLVAPDPPALSALTLRLTGRDLVYEMALNPDGTFTLSGVQAGTYDALLSLRQHRVRRPHPPRHPLPVTQEL